MRIDLYTKTILTLIALLLAVIALKPILQPQTVKAGGSFSGVQFSATVGGFWVFDSSTGDVWAYNSGSGKADIHFKVTKLGQPLGQ
jgi:hypothetical protein